MSLSRHLPTRQLGEDGPQVSGLGLGMMELSGSYGAAPPDEERFKVLDRAWELGVTFWDTAAGYGDSEEFIGKWLKMYPERRRDIYLCTKFGVSAKVGDDGNYVLSLDSSPGNCRKSCERSLRNLGVNFIDLFYIHRFDRVTPVERTMETLVELKKEGKINCIGLSECSSNTLRRAHAIHTISAVQVEYNPWALEIESEIGTNLLSTCRELGVAVVAYSPLGRGFLTGKFKSLEDFDEKDPRRKIPRFSPENFPKNLELVKIFENLASKKGCTPAQLVLAWTRAQGPEIFPIPGTKTIEYLEQNVGCFDVTIDPEENKYIRDSIISAGGARGERSIGSINPFADTPSL